ncbi:hypothetical protein ACX0G7_22725 [Flavitalea antarctica]
MEQSTNLFELHVDHNGSVFLREVAKWSKFLSIVGFVGMGLAMLFLIFAGSFSSTILNNPAYGGSNSMYAGSFFQIVFLGAFMLIYFFPCLYLFRFATKMQVALRNNDQDTLNASFENLKSCFKFIGIFTIVILSIYALALLVGLFALGSMM